MTKIEAAAAGITADEGEAVEVVVDVEEAVEATTIIKTSEIIRKSLETATNTTTDSTTLHRRRSSKNEGRIIEEITTVEAAEGEIAGTTRESKAEAERSPMLVATDGLCRSPRETRRTSTRVTCRAR